MHCTDLNYYLQMPRGIDIETPLKGHIYIFAMQIISVLSEVIDTGNYAHKWGV